MTQTTLIEKLSLQWDLRLGPYRGYFPESEEAVQTCLQMVGLGEEGSAGLSENESLQQFAACEDTRSNEIVACLYLNDIVKLSENPPIQGGLQSCSFPRRVVF